MVQGESDSCYSLTADVFREELDCLACGGPLFLVELDTTMTRFRGQIATETYRCAACDAGYVVTPSTGWWKSTIAVD